MNNLQSIGSISAYVNMMRGGRFPTLETQKYQCYSEFSRTWNDFVFYESARVADQLGYGCAPLAFINDLTYT
jgi:hypothetical protein